MSEEFDHFLGFGIIITKQYLKRSPYLEEYLKEKSQKINKEVRTYGYIAISI